ncbi:hypothetical protein KBTX_02949 [wastewater metagenome]|uniref:Lipoyl-binding domain-containing protein n=2 Tax=unclassified sequences TaxID=12908 RepID=A0A5B8RBW4_9ZZZZ|nr:MULTISPECIES: lipoyl domain-containing protein [Arhodomonas]MCS4504612.1 lipoyl domain-containing protein [Arhodomonas aquaeolei]QEA06609.1 hypothetical protein KBTEX_02949 [uncultured organism]
MADVRIPEGLWDADITPEGVVANWLYRDGSEVDAGETVAEIMVEKATMEITAPAAGRLAITVAKDGVVRPGTVIGRIDEQ